jgi:hypothetical protein
MGLHLRGAQPHFLLCDGALAACEEANHYHFGVTPEFGEHGPGRTLCPYCHGTGKDIYSQLPLPLHWYGEFTSTEESKEDLVRARGMSTEDCFGFELGGMPLGEHVRAGVLRYFKRGTLDELDPREVQAAAARYLAGALTTARVLGRVIDRLKPEVVVAHHGIYVPQGIVDLVARARGLRIVNWGMAYRDRSVIYSHHDTYHRTMLHEPTSLWDSRPLTEPQAKEIEEYLARRRAGGDIGVKWTAELRDVSGLDASDRNLLRALGLDPAKPVYGLLPNILWDAGIYYGTPVFETMLDWLFVTVDHFLRDMNQQLIIRVHPHEAQPRHTYQKVIPELERRYGRLPDTIRVVAPEDPTSTYRLMDLCRAVLVYGTKTGLEIAAAGIPVVVAGEAWIRNKGFSMDVVSREHYEEILAKAYNMHRLSADIVARARRYAYYFFFERMIPVPGIDSGGGWPPKLALESLGELMPGAHAGMETICDGILKGKDFIYRP